MQRFLVLPRISALVLAVGMLLAAALMLAGGSAVSQAEPAQGSSAKQTVLADSSTGLRKPLEP
ncbi:hypothetical protein [Nonomuraea sp. NPDC049480]|uniref:hypothetical protein n=1 Tax=Nonomuraea sp. NPDC049480 TaxID=3364353 RepID=UPI003795F882